MRPIMGVCYFPVPSDILSASPNPYLAGTYKYGNWDLLNADFSALWGPTGRDDIGDLARRLHVNSVRSYLFNPSYDHIPYLDYCLSQGIKVVAPIANYYLLDVSWSVGSTAITALVKQIGSHPAVVAWGLTNELVSDPGCPHLNCTAQVVRAAELILSLDPSTRPIMVTHVYDSVAFWSAATVQNAFAAAGMQSFLATRYVAGLNMYFAGQAPAVMALSFTTSVVNFMAAFPTTSLAITEYGANTDWTGDNTLQAAAVATQAAAVVQLLATYPRFLGAYLFAWQNDLTQADNDYGVRQYVAGTFTTALTPSHQAYRVDVMQDKPAYAALAALAAVVTTSAKPPPRPAPRPPPSSPPSPPTSVVGSVMKPVFGINYFPVPSDIATASPNPYLTGAYGWGNWDLLNADFSALWGPTGRDDIGDLARRLHVNSVRSYLFDPAFDHIPYLDYCLSQGIKVVAPVANLFLLNMPWSTGAATITALVKQIGSHPAVVAWGLTNELAWDAGCPNLNCMAQLVQATQLLLLLDTSSRPIMVTHVYDSVDFHSVKTVQSAFVTAGMQTFLATRYIAGVNMYFFGQAPSIMAISLKTSVINFMAAYPTTSLAITEYGSNTDWTGDNALQAAAVGTQAATVVQLLATYPRFLGAYLYAWQNDLTQSQNDYGVRQYVNNTFAVALTPSNQIYRVDAMQDKPAFAALQAVGATLTG